jgi:hypothetical protein
MKGVILLKRHSLTRPEKWILIGTPFLFVMGWLFHYLYDFSGKIAIIGAISPVNESVWEHAKLLVVPVILWWIAYYIFKSRKYGIDANHWFTGMLVSIVLSIISMMSLFYFYTQAFGVKLLSVDISILFLADLIGQWSGLNAYRHTWGLKAFAALFLSAAILALFVVWTFDPPHYPLFMDSVTKSYGI